MPCSVYPRLSVTAAVSVLADEAGRDALTAALLAGFVLTLLEEGVAVLFVVAGLAETLVGVLEVAVVVAGRAVVVGVLETEVELAGRAVAVEGLLVVVEGLLVAVVAGLFAVFAA